MNVQMKVARLNRAQSSGFFGGFAFGGLAMRKPGVGRSLGKVHLLPPLVLTRRNSMAARAAITDRQPLAAVKTSQRGLNP
jgi:hypothetical protein